MIIKDNDGVDRYYLNEKVVTFCEKNREKISKEDTMVFGIVTGLCGGGKSLLAQWIGYCIDPTLDIERICMNRDDFMEQIRKHKKKVIIGDEGVSILYKRNVMTREGREVTEFMNKIRAQNNIVILCVPKITDVDKDVLLDADMVNFIITVWESKNKNNETIKGNFRIYLNTKKVKTATNYAKFVLGRNGVMRFIKCKKPPFQIQQEGSSYKKKVWYPVGEKEYRKLKNEDLDRYGKVKQVKKEKPKPLKTIKKELMMDIILTMKKNNPNLSDNKIAELVGYSRKRINSLRNMAEKGNEDDKYKLQSQEEIK